MARPNAPNARGSTWRATATDRAKLVALDRTWSAKPQWRRLTPGIRDGPDGRPATDRGARPARGTARGATPRPARGRASPGPPPARTGPREPARRTCTAGRGWRPDRRGGPRTARPGAARAPAWRRRRRRRR